jgi:hypothetical protein
MLLLYSPLIFLDGHNLGLIVGQRPWTFGHDVAFDIRSAVRFDSLPYRNTSSLFKISIGR